jgi:hypothetical protein
VAEELGRHIALVVTALVVFKLEKKEITAYLGGEEL